MANGTAADGVARSDEWSQPGRRARELLARCLRVRVSQLKRLVSLQQRLKVLGGNKLLVTARMSRSWL
ncbi:hypothetical protein NL676_012379 [Syzygium grande]|nr:hypothetical protein NL676_012379 [Syzygium grande]